MKIVNLEIEIDASAEKVWNAIVTDALYREWAEAFQAGSYFEGGWNKGDAIQFLSLNEAGLKEGMVSEIAESDCPRFISIKHLGMIMDGTIDTTSEAVTAWLPSFENYTLEAIGEHKTRFVLEMESDDAYYDMFIEMWQRAMQKLKAISER